MSRHSSAHRSPGRTGAKLLRRVTLTGALVVGLALPVQAPAAGTGATDRGGAEVFERVDRTVVADAPIASLPSGFRDTILWRGLTFPTGIAFSRTGKVFVAEKSGIIKVFDSPVDPTPHWDRATHAAPAARRSPASPSTPAGATRPSTAGRFLSPTTTAAAYG